MNSSHFETIIIGAGPAGLIAGRHLKDALLLDKKKEIGKPVQCGEGISLKALERENLKPDPSWVSGKIYKMERITPNGKAMGKRSENPKGYIIDRSEFEKFLFKSCSCEIKPGAKVTSLNKTEDGWEVRTEDNQVFTSEYLIGADGPFSLVRQKIFPENQKNLDHFCGIEYLLELEKELDTEVAKFYLDNELYKNGYAWIFPKGKNLANVGVGGDRVKWADFEKFLQTKVRPKYGEYKFRENRSGSVPSGGFRGSLEKDGAMLVGDAAGLADPIFDGGMTQAMQSARIAAECILKKEVGSYEEKIKAQVFASADLLQAKKAFYSLDNQTLNALGDILNNKSSSYLKSLPGIMKFFLNKDLRRNRSRLFRFFSVWAKAKDSLW